MNKKEIDILLKLVFLAACCGIGWGVSELIIKHKENKETKFDIYDQFEDIILISNDDVDYVVWIW